MQAQANTFSWLGKEHTLSNTHLSPPRKLGWAQCITQSLGCQLDQAKFKEGILVIIVYVSLLDPFELQDVIILRIDCYTPHSYKFAHHLKKKLSIFLAIWIDSQKAKQFLFY